MSPSLRIAKSKLKLARMRKLLKAVKERPQTIHEGQKLLQNAVSKRMVENYFAELKALGLVEYDSEAKAYQQAGIRKQVFENKRDYDLALKHSKTLTFTTKEKQGFDSMNPLLALDRLVFYEYDHFAEVDQICILKHLQTGYFNEVYALMQRYRQLMDKTGLSEGSGLPKLPPEESAMTHVESIKGKYIDTEEIVRVPLGASQKDFVEKYNLPHQIAKQTLKEIYYLRNLLVGKIYSIYNDVRHGIPLRGYCDHCPHQKLAIRD